MFTISGEQGLYWKTFTTQCPLCSRALLMFLFSGNQPVSIYVQVSVDEIPWCCRVSFISLLPYPLSLHGFHFSCLGISVSDVWFKTEMQTVLQTGCTTNTTLCAPRANHTYWELALHREHLRITTGCTFKIRKLNQVCDDNVVNTKGNYEYFWVQVFLAIIDFPNDPNS